VPNGFRETRIPKGNGKFRIIHVPDPPLKDKLSRILKIIMSLAIPAGPHIHAYVRRRNIVTNARKLQAWDNFSQSFITPRYLLKLDVKDFFNSLRSVYVIEACEYAKIPQRIIDQIEKHCFVRYKGVEVLPQGSPTSPFLSNLVMRGIAARVNGLLKVLNDGFLYPIRFSIYCDNLSFTCDSKRVAGIVQPIARILDDYELSLNKRKIEFHSPPARKVVCGVQLNENSLAVPRSYWRRLRAEIANAIIDFRAGYVPRGSRLIDSARKAIRKNFVGRSPGAIQTIIPSLVQPYLMDPNNTVSVPCEEWLGKIAFIRSIDPRRGQLLADLMHKWETM
jgi:RNA-directed DNA polymerase